MIDPINADNAEVRELVQDSLQATGAAEEKLPPAHDPPPNSPAAPTALNASDAGVGVLLSGAASASVSKLLSAQGLPGSSVSERRCDSIAAHQQILKTATEQEPAAAQEEGIPHQPAEQLDAAKGGCPVEEAMQPQTGLLGGKEVAQQAAFSPSARSHAGLLPDSKLTARDVEVQGRTVETDSTTTLQNAAVDAAAEASPGTPLPERGGRSLGGEPAAEAVDTVCELEIDLSLGQPCPLGDPTSPGGDKHAGERDVCAVPRWDPRPIHKQPSPGLRAVLSAPGQCRPPQPSQILPTATLSDHSNPSSSPYLNPHSLPDQPAVGEPESRKRGVDRLDSSKTPYLNPQSLPDQPAVAVPESRKWSIDSIRAHCSVEPCLGGQPWHQQQSTPGGKHGGPSGSFAKDARNEGRGALEDRENQVQALGGSGGQAGPPSASEYMAKEKPLHAHRQTAEPAMEADVPRALFSCFDLLADVPASVDPGAACQGMVHLSAMHVLTVCWSQEA